MTLKLSIVAFIVAACAMSVSAQAQTPQGKLVAWSRATGSGVDTIEKVADGAMLTMYITVKGAVSKPGIYHVASTAHLADIIEYAGGLMPYARKSDIHILHDLSNSQLLAEPELLIDYGAYQETNDPMRNPLLTANDVISISDMGSQNMDR